MSGGLQPILSEPIASPAVQVAVVFATRTHVGLSYQLNRAGERRYLHLASHYRLRDDDRPPQDARWVRPGLDELELNRLRTATAQVARRHADGRIPYGLDVANAAFVADGRLHLGVSRGLTCATFVMRVFQHAGLPLLEEASGAERSVQRELEDEAKQRALVTYLLGSDDADARAQGKCIEPDIGCLRYRPEEVAAASGMPVRPVDFPRAESGGHLLLAQFT